MKAHEALQVEFEVVYVPTKHNSDLANNFNLTDQDSRDANITLNMLKIKNQPTDNDADSYAQFMPKSTECLSNYQTGMHEQLKIFQDNFMPLRKSLQSNEDFDPRDINCNN